MTEQTVTTEHTAPAVVHVNPNDLIFSTNVRLDPRLDEEFIASITERGVIEPVVACPREDGALVIRAGHRRSLAAADAGHASIPVYVIPETTDADRLIDQMAENDHRAALTTGERVAAFAQLDALGLSAADIAKQTATKPAHVKAALTVAASAIATGAASRWEFLTLDQAATLADFEGNDDTVKALVVAAKSGQFDHVAQRARDERDLHHQGEILAEGLREAGVTLIEAPDYNDTPQRLNHLLEDGRHLTLATHDECPGHAAFITTAYEWVTHEAAPDEDEPDEDQDDEGDDDDDEPPHRSTGHRAEVMSVAYVCCDPAKYGHRSAFTTSAGTPKVKVADLPADERAAEKARSRDVIDSNKASKSAQVVRREWLATFAKRKTPPKATAHFIAATLTASPYLLDRAGANARTYACDLLGAIAKPYGAGAADLVTDKTTTPRAQVVSLVVLLAAYEHETTHNDWRQVREDTTRYLRFIEAQGYALSDVERRACGEDLTPTTTTDTPDQPREPTETADEPEETPQAA